MDVFENVLEPFFPGWLPACLLVVVVANHPYTRAYLDFICLMLYIFVLPSTFRTLDVHGCDVVRFFTSLALALCLSQHTPLIPPHRTSVSFSFRLFGLVLVFVLVVAGEV